MGKTFLIDTTKCTACRGCQVACKQWKKLPAEQTAVTGSHQNPADLSFITFKLVRMQEAVVDGKLNWLFFPDQCRHCIEPPCMEVADFDVEGAVTRDEKTGAVLFTELTKQLSDWESVKDACPYNIPRHNPETGLLSKCDMCFDRISNGLKPACVQSCPTGTMAFGEREEMLELAEERLAAAKKKFPDAILADAEEVRVIFLLAKDPALYHDYAVASAKAPLTLARFNRRKSLGNVLASAKRILA